jgi:Icc-related predicted phosphoesterase
LAWSIASFRSSNEGHKQQQRATTRLFFATDLHGSEICFRKFLNAGPAYEADVVIMGGDCTGKMVIPLVREDGVWVCRWAGETHEARDGDEAAELEKRIRNQGYYPVRVSNEEMGRLEQDKSAVDALFRAEMVTTLTRWVALAEERLGGSGIRVVMTPGNDDEFDIDPVLARSSFIEAGNDRILEIDGGYEMLSLGWANPTPWQTPRETTEEDLRRRIDELASGINDMERAIFNIHVPPFGTGLDFAPELEAGDRLKRGGAITTAVGSTAVRDAIVEYQPMLSLHGHIHESRAIQKLGRTVCINPGSSYSDWRLQGVVVDLTDGRVKRYVPVTG